MEAQLQRPAQENTPQDVDLQSGDGQPGQKKSILKKVKDKAKKLKHSMKKHGDGQEHGYTYDDNREEGDDDDDEDDEEIHGAPTQDSSVIKSTNLPTQQNPTDTRGDRYDEDTKSEAKARPNIPAQTGYEQDQPQDTGDQGFKFGQSTGLEEDPHSPDDQPGDIPVSSANYESKLSDPSGEGSKEAAVGSLVHKFDNLNVGNESETKPEQEPRSFTGSHDQFSPQQTPTKDEFSESSKTDQDVPPNTITGKASSATSTLTDKVFSAKNLVAAKLGYGGGSGQGGGSQDQSSPRQTPTKDEFSEPKSLESSTTDQDVPPNTITGKVSSATSALTDKAIYAKNLAAAKLGYGGDSGQEGRSHDQFSPQQTSSKDEFNPHPESEPKSSTSALTDKAISAKNLVAAKLGYGGGPGKDEFNQESHPQSEHQDVPRDTTGKVSSATSAITDRAISAKNLVAAKLGYGGVSGQEGTKTSSDKPESESAPAPGYTQKITDTLNPVYEKVTGAGTAVLSKFQGGGGEAGNQGTDKGVSVRDYWTEKLKPGDEDKALSDQITEAISKKKEGFQKTGEGKPTGKVTESDEVANRLGSGSEDKRAGEDALSAGSESSGPGVVGRVKDAVGSWIGKGSGTTQTAQDSINDSYANNAGNQGN